MTRANRRLHILWSKMSPLSVLGQFTYSANSSHMLQSRFCLSSGYRAIERFHYLHLQLHNPLVLQEPNSIAMDLPLPRLNLSSPCCGEGGAKVGMFLLRTQDVHSMKRWTITHFTSHPWMNIFIIINLLPEQ